jgi:aspartyl protease/PDZ domain-containing protein
MKNPTLYLLLLLLCCSQLPAQYNFQSLQTVRKIDIPFEYENDLIVVRVTFNQIFPLKFIFDTGAEHTILARKEVTDLFGVPYEREFKLLGSDMKTELTAYLVRNIHLRVGNMVIPNHSMLVLDDDYFRFQEISGVEVHGILGADVFRGLVVKINYDRKVITLMKKSSFKGPGKGYDTQSIEVFRNKPYLITNVSIRRDSSAKVKLLLDTGATLAMMLYTDTHPSLELPPHTLKGQIGMGLGGYLEGYLGRVHQLEFGGEHFNEVLTNFQDVNEGMDTTLLFGRNGIIGNKILNRFSVILDYTSEKMYLKPSRRFSNKFDYDKSGLVVIAAGSKLNSFVVIDVLEGSPAAEAGLQKGDILKRVNLFPSAIFSLRDLHRIFSRKAGKKVRVVFMREGKRLKKSFTLRNLI